MPKFVVKSQSAKSAKESFNKVSSMLEDSADLKKLDAAFKCHFDAEQLTGQASGKMFKANLTVKEVSPGSEVSIEVDLPLSLALVKGMVEKKLRQQLEQVLS